MIVSDDRGGGDRAVGLLVGESVATTSSTSSAVSSGRAASWIATSSVPTALERVADRFGPRLAAVDDERGPRRRTRGVGAPAGTATTIEPTDAASRIASIDHSTIGLPPNSTKAFGPPAPSL